MMRRSLCYLLPMVISAVFLGGCLFTGSAPVQRLVTIVEAETALEVATTKLGDPYVWGARGPDEFDSSGIIVWSYKQVIQDVRFRGPRNTVLSDTNHANLYAHNFEPLPLEELKPGDIVYLTDGTAPVTHGTMFVRWVEPYEVMEFLDASTRLGKVVIQEWPVYGEVRGQWFVAGGRLKIVL